MVRLFNGLLVVFAIGLSGVTLPMVALAEAQHSGMPSVLLAQASKSEADKLLQDALQLYRQGTLEAKQQALPKLQQALSIYKATGDRFAEAITLSNVGIVYFSLGESKQALTYFDRALPIFKTLGNKIGEAHTLDSIGDAYTRLGDNQKALTYYEQALPIFKVSGDKLGEADALAGIGYAYTLLGLGKKQEALSLLNQALTIVKSIGTIGDTYNSFANNQQFAGDRVLPFLKDVNNKSGKASVLSYIGGVYFSLGDNQQALNYFKQTLPILKAVGDKSEEATTLNNIGIVYNSLGDKQQALFYYNQALPLFKPVGDKSGEAATLTNIGTVYNSLGDKQQALSYYNQALPLFKAVGSKSGEATTLTNIGSVYSDLGDKQQTLLYYNQALPLFKAVGDKSGEAATLTGIGGVYNALGDRQQALSFYNQALPIFKAVGNKSGEATTLNNIGGVYNALGDRQQALKFYNQALPIFKAVGDKSGEAATLTGIGGVYLALGDWQQALNFYNQALPIFKAVGNKSGEATTLNNIGSVYNALGDRQQALSFYNQALPIFKAVGDKSGEANTLNNIGGVYYALGDRQQALSFYNLALPILKVVGNKSGEANTLNNIGGVYNALGDRQQALSFYNLALPIFKAVGDKSGEANTLRNLALLQRSEGNLTAALTNIEQSIANIEALRANIVNPDLRTSYFASVQDYYRTYIDILMRLHKQQPTKGYDALALNASESARARGLLDLLTEAKADIKQGADPKLLEQERTLQIKLNALEKRRIEILSASKPIPPSFEQEYNNTNQQYQQNKDQIRISSPRYAALTQPKPLKLAEIQQLLDDNTIILEYSLGKDRSYLWLISKNKLTSYELPKQADIEQLVKQYRNILTDRNHDAATINLSKLAPQLRQTLLAPVADQLGSKRLVIVADGALQYIPFAALPSNANNQPLLISNEVIHLPSASSLGILRQQNSRRQTPPKTVAVLADPVFSSDDDRLPNHKLTTPTTAKTINQNILDRGATDNGIGKFYRLTNTKTEGEAILSLVAPDQGKLSLSFAANLENATSPDLSQYRIVHFATHGLMDSVDPKRSGVVLSLIDEKGEAKNGYLRLQDIFNLNLGADLVVLSACQTGIGKEIQGEGLVGLTRGFMYAGAPRVVVSLWNVDDEATSILMGKFYEGILKKGLPPSVALREAQKAMMRDPKYQASYYWAAFVLQGEWK